MRRHVIAAGVASLALLAGCAQGTPPAATPMNDVTPSVSLPSTQPTAVDPTRSETSPVQSPSPSHTPASVTPTPSPKPTVEMVLARGQVTAKVRELQARLRQLGYYSAYDVTNVFGPATSRGVAKFQAKKGLPASGNVDRPTWDALVAATKTPSDDELANRVPGAAVITASSKKVKELQHRLSQVGCYSGAIDGSFPADGVRCFQRKKNLTVNGRVDQRTWDKLKASTRKPTPSELGDATAPETSDASGLPQECTKWGRAICVSMSERKVRWVVDGKVLLTMAARFGNSEAGYPTKPGTFRVWLKAKDYVSKAYDVPMPYSMFYDYEGRAVHYSENFAKLGYRSTSHGCVNVRDLNGISWLFGEVHQGDHVVIYK